MGLGFTNYGVYVAIMMATLLPWRQARISIAVWGLLLLSLSLLTRTWTPAYIALIAVGIALATASGIEGGRISHKLQRAEQRVSVLAIAAERERIGRDLHDILGHSLTAISIKSQLARRLVDHDPAAARAQIEEVEEIARQALADVRATASGLAEIRVATEIAGARAVLMAAGIEAHVPTSIEPLSDEREPALRLCRTGSGHQCRAPLRRNGVHDHDLGGRGTGGRRRLGTCSCRRRGPRTAGAREAGVTAGGELEVSGGTRGGDCGRGPAEPQPARPDDRPSDDAGC